MDPWAEFRSSESNAANLVRNDAPPIVSDRQPVPSSARVMGDAEAQASGLYETPAGPWDAFRKQPMQPAQVPQADFSQRFGEFEQPSEPDALQAGLEQRAAQITKGPEVSPVNQMATDISNLVPAASQGTNPNVARYGGKLVSAEVFEGDDGSIQYRDPADGQIKPTDTKTQVAIRDPADGTVKIFDRSEATDEGPAVGVSRVLAPGLAAGAVTARPGIAAATKVAPKASDIFSTAKPYYKAFKNEARKIGIPNYPASNVATKAPVMTAGDITNRIRGALDNSNFIEELAPPVYKAAGIIDKGQPITLDVLQNMKRVVGKSFNSPDKNVRDAAGVASKEIGKIIAEISSSASKNLKTGDEIFSTAKSLQDLQRKGAVADLRAGRAGYGGNAVNTMRQVLTPIVQKAVEGKITGFKPNEVQAIRDIVEGTNTTNSMRLVGQLSPTSGLGVIKAAGAGGTAIAAGASGGTALAIPAIGMAANKLATILTGKQIERLNSLVAKRSPAYAEAVAKAITRYEKAQTEFANSPGPNKLAAYISASRALSSGLTRDGIQITSGDLIRLLQSPAKTAAEPDQQPVPGQPAQ